MQFFLGIDNIPMHFDSLFYMNMQYDVSSLAGSQ